MQDQSQAPQLFKHQDGGYYRLLGMGRHTDDQSMQVVYEHLWPFEPGLPWIRQIGRAHV